MFYFYLHIIKYLDFFKMHDQSTKWFKFIVKKTFYFDKTERAAKKTCVRHLYC